MGEFRLIGIAIGRIGLCGLDRFVGHYFDSGHYASLESYRTASGSERVKDASLSLSDLKISTDRLMCGAASLTRSLPLAVLYQSLAAPAHISCVNLLPHTSSRARTEAP